MGRVAVVAGWVGVGHLAVLARVAGALSQQGGTVGVGVVEEAKVGAWESRAEVGVGAGVGVVEGNRGAGAGAGLEPARWGLPQPLPLGPPPWAWGSQHW